MCIKSSEWIPSSLPYSAVYRRRRSKRSKVRVRRLTRRRRSGEDKTMVGVGKEMEIKNLKLFLKNQSIMLENENLRKKAHLLHQENRALMSEFQKKFSHLDDFATLLLHKNTH